ncbi:hypothetical protein OPW32_21125 [Vibrio europaeus]|uniref:hypothetical protein n=1 Tax=Vibrio europaeus TaxID=300876 RepID=UPI00233FBD80|nr:hypothetical protein [Vibrio europaeus]MDC5851696.1 hypothetical protein [Vibrio europaeus]
MEQNKLFRLIWRFNGIIILVAGVLAIGILLLVTKELYQDATRERSVGNMVNVADNPESKQTLTLGSIVSIKEPNTLMVPLYSDQSFDHSYYSKSTYATRNYLFIESQPGTQRWLFEHNDYLIERAEILRLNENEANQPSVGILYQVIKSDTDENDRISSSDLSTIAITKPDGTHYHEVINDVERLVDHHLISDDELLVIYQKAGLSYSAVIKLNSGKVLDNSHIPTLSKK